MLQDPKGAMKSLPFRWKVACWGFSYLLAGRKATHLGCHHCVPTGWFICCYRSLRGRLSSTAGSCSEVHQTYWLGHLLYLSANCYRAAWSYQCSIRKFLLNLGHKISLQSDDDRDDGQMTFCFSNSLFWYNSWGTVLNRSAENRERSGGMPGTKTAPKYMQH